MKSENLKILFASVLTAIFLFARGDSNPQSLKNPPAEKQSVPIAQALNSFFNTASAVPIKYPVRKDWTLLDPQLQVKSALAKDLDSGVVMYGFNIQEKWALASLTKLMTAVIALEEMDSNQIVIISERAMATEGIAGNLQLGGQYAVSDLVKAMLVLSSNRAAMAIADSYGFSRFVEKMQVKVVSLNMSQADFIEPTGLFSGNSASIEDLEKLVSYIYKNHPEIFAITRQKTAILSDLAKNSSEEFLNINAFAQSRDDFWGGKTGYTDQSGGNLITIFEHEGRKLLFIVLGTDDRFGQTDLLYNWAKRAFTFN